jgi:nitrogen fixation/metabolism regulation signal transduction histidine kinase
MLFAFLVCSTHSYVSIVIVAVIAIIQVSVIITEVHKTNRLLSVFFDSVKFDDYTMSFNFKGRGKSFEALGKSLTMVSSQFKAIREEKEAQYQFNQNILHNVGIGIIAYDSKGEIAFSNKLFHTMMQIPYCTSLEKLGRFNQELVTQLVEIEQKKKRLFKREENAVSQHFLLTASEFVVHNRMLKLVVVQNIQPTIDQTEMDAWQKLIRVLTHEIMNSITPIASLAGTAYTLLPGDSDSIEKETLDDLREALQTINRRSDGLISFVQQYRSLTAIPQPVLAIIQVDELIQRVATLFRSELQTTAILFETSIPENGLELIADSSLIEQVVLNLLKNAQHAVEKTSNAKIVLSAFENEFQKIVITVTDNGCGILPEVIDKIFIPFFTTKPNGSGIGLSLSKQIMLMHGGTIIVTATIEQGSTFVLRF